MKKNEEPKKKTNIYVSNKEMFDELIKWKESAENEDDRIISERFGEMILLIARHLTNHSNFKYYPNYVKEEMVSYACFKCIQGIKNYNFNYKNAFGYFTQACYNAFISTLYKYYKHKNIKNDLLSLAIMEVMEDDSIRKTAFIEKMINDLSENQHNREDN